MIVLAFLLVVAVGVWGVRLLAHRIGSRLRKRSEQRSQACLKAEAGDLHRRGSATTL